MPFADENSLRYDLATFLISLFSPNELQQSRSRRPFEWQRFGSRCAAQRNATTQQTCHIKGLKIFTVVGSAVGPPVWKCANMEGSVSAQEHPFWPQASRRECSSPASKGSFTGNLSRFRDNSRSLDPGSDDKELRQGAN